MIKAEFAIKIKNTNRIGGAFNAKNVSKADNEGLKASQYSIVFKNVFYLTKPV